MRCKVLFIPHDITEDTFSEYITSTIGFKCKKIRKSNLKDIIEALRDLDNYQDNWLAINDLISYKLEELMTRGCADFFVYNKTQFYFCEFKSTGDSLSIEQIKWFETYQDLPLMLAVAYTKDRWNK